MSLISDRLASLALVLDRADQQRLSADIATFARAVDGSSTIDFRGNVSFDETAVRAAAVDLQKRTDYAVGFDFPDELVSSFRGGFVLLNGRGDLLPLTHLRGDRELLGRLSTEQFRQLGVTAGLDPAESSAKPADRNPALARIASSQIATLQAALKNRQVFETHLSARAQVG